MVVRVADICSPPSPTRQLYVQSARRARPEHMIYSLIGTPQTEEFTDCRIDHYQTPANVNVSVFAKQVDKERSAVIFESEKVRFVHKLSAMAACETDKLMTRVAALTDTSTDPYRFVSARWQTFQTFPRLVRRNRSRHVVIQDFRHKGTVGMFELSLHLEGSTPLVVLSLSYILSSTFRNAYRS